MKQYKYCDTCKEFHYTTEECPPIHQVFHEDCTGDEGSNIHAYDHHDAAMKYAEEYNTRGDYSLMNNTEIVTVVRDGVTKTFEISAEPTIDYSADEIDPTE